MAELQEARPERQKVGPRASAILQGAIIVLVAATAVYTNWPEPRRSVRSTTAPPIGLPGAPLSSGEGLERRVREMEAKLAEQPADAGAAVLLAEALLRQTRVVGNPGLAVRAERVLEPVLREYPGDYDASRMLAQVYLSQHRFREAIAVGRRNRDARPADPANYGAIGDAHLELGEYDEAFHAFDRMMALRPSAAAYARVAYARELQGNLTGALEAMKLAADATAGSDLEALAWHYAQMGELYLQLGQHRQAKQAFATASQAFPGHPFAVSGYARAIAAEGDVAGALTLMRELAARAPTPETYAHIGDLLERQQRHDEARSAYAAAEAAWRSDAPEPKNLARFLADRGVKLDEAVRLAERAAAERDDIFTNDALAWAYFKANRIEAAKTRMARALRTGTRDATVRAHAALIEVADSSQAP